LQLKDGENQILAGLIDDEARKTIDKFPGIGNLPLVGRLFSSHSNDHKRDEIVLSITPHLIRNTSRPDAAMLAFDSGTEASLGKTGIGSSVSVSASAAASAPVAVPSPVPRPPATNTSSPAQAPAQVSPAMPTSVSSPTISTGTQPALQFPQSTATPVTSGAVVNPAGPAAGAAMPPTLSIAGPARVKEGESFTVQVVLNQSQPATTVSNVNFALHYDPAVIGVLNIAEGNVLQQGGAATNFRPELNGGAGQLAVADARLTPASGAPMTQGGSLLNLTLRALRASDATPVALLSAALTDQTGAALTVPVPAPLSVTVVP
jgi:general secretion pathway protein D